jgi:sulfoxide reductase heme-binding subunit YedZ
MRIRLRAGLIAAASLAVSVLITATNPQGTRIEEWSIATAYVAILLLAITLILGPLNLLRRRRNPTHSVIRRDFGIAAGICSLIHTALGLQVHMGGRLVRYFTLPDNPSSGLTAFLVANYLGLMSAGMLLMLVVISNDIAIRRLGLARWKRTQRLLYPAVIGVAAHGFIYQFLEKRALAGILVLAAAFLGVGWVQLRGAAASRLLREREGAPFVSEG